LIRKRRRDIPAADFFPEHKPYLGAALNLMNVGILVGWNREHKSRNSHIPFFQYSIIPLPQHSKKKAIS
jgi:hypothetical protein